MIKAKPIDKKYFNIADVIAESPETRLFHIVGQRGVGKTFSVKKYVIDQYLATGKKFVYVRRWTTEIQGQELRGVFTDVVDYIDFTRLPKKFASFHRYHILPKASQFWLVGEKLDGTLDFLETVGRITCISKAEQFKGGTYNEFNTVMFDEYITERGYIGGDKEPELFAKIVNTVGRETKTNADLRIFMLGNPDASIEACPYVTNLKLDYSRLQVNTAYHFDSKTNGKVLANNIVFVKLGNYNGTFLNEYTSGLFETAEEEMSLTGEVKTYKFIHDDDVFEQFKPEIGLIVETPVITNEEFHKKIYVYYGMMYNEVVCVVLTHHKWDLENTLYCRYEELDFRPRPYPQTFRVNIPPLEEYAPLKRMMACVDATHLTLTDDDRSATLYQQIMINS